MKITQPLSDAHGGLSMGSVFEISETIEDTARRLGVKIPLITWDWNTRLTSTMGFAEHPSNRLGFSYQLWPNATYDQRKHTVIHETVHLAAYEKYGRSIIGRPHGREWKAMMIEAGELPTRCHTVPRPDSPSMITGHCICKEHKITVKRFRKHGSNLRCKNCKTPLAFESASI